MRFTAPVHDIAPAGQRLYLTVLFSDLADSPELGERMEAEQYVEMLEGLRAVCQSIILKHGGHIARMQGDGMLAVFGLPGPREDDGRRAAEAALEMHAAVGALPLPGDDAPSGALALHSGIHAGLTFVREGSAEIGTLEVLGDVPNTAARLASVAQRGEIVVSEETLGAEAHFFETSEPESVRLRGRDRPLVVLRVLDRMPVQRRYEARAVRGLAPFVGREGELRALLDHLDAATRGEPRCIAVLGGPGLGKTRLIEELLRSAPASRCTVLQGYCESYLGAEPLRPFLQLLRGLLGLKPGMSAVESSSLAESGMALKLGLSVAVGVELLRTLSIQTPGSEPRRAEANATVEAFAALVDTLAARQPVLLLLDDWQWADVLSQRVLDGILALRRPVCVVLASRIDGAGEVLLPPRTTSIELAPLGLDETRRTLEHLLPEADPFAIAEIHRYGGGVPLFIEELCHSMASQRLERPPAWRLASAAWLAALVESRVQRLPFEQRQTVRAAAVIGNVFPSWLLQRITGHDEDAPLVQALASQDLIFPSEQPGMLRFKHGVTRDVIYDAVGLSERTSIHKQVAEALRTRGNEAEHDDLLEALAYHCAAGGMPAEAARYAEKAGDKAIAAFALDRARAQYASALKELDSMAPLQRADKLRWCVLAEKLGMACVFDPLALGDGVALFERSLGLAQQVDDAPAMARARYWLGYILYALGRAVEAVSHCEIALELATELGDERLAAQVRATLGQSLQCACDYERALPLIDTALTSKRARGRPGSSIAVGSAYSLACKGAMLGDRGQFALADECFDEAMALLGSTTHQVASSVRNWISATHQWQGRWADAARMAEGSVQVAEHCKSRQLLAMGRALWGHAHWRLSGEPAGLQAVLDATSWIEERNGALVTSLNYGWLVEGSVARGQLAEARRHAARLFLGARRRDRLGEAMGCRALAIAAAQDGDPAAADRYLAQAERAAHFRGSAHEQACNQLCRARIAVFRERRADALRPLDMASAAFERMAMPWHLQQAGDLRRQL